MYTTSYRPVAVMDEVFSQLFDVIVAIKAKGNSVLSGGMLCLDVRSGMRSRGLHPVVYGEGIDDNYGFESRLISYVMIRCSFLNRIYSTTTEEN